MSIFLVNPRNDLVDRGGLKTNTSASDTFVYVPQFNGKQTLVHVHTKCAGEKDGMETVIKKITEN